MAPAAVAIFVISLFAESLAAPNRCASCQTWESQSGYQQTQSGSGGWINQDNLSQRSANLEDLTQQAETELSRSPTQLAFDNGRPGNWTDVNRYRTADGHGRVYEEQGQRVQGPTRIRFYRKNFTSSSTSGDTGAFRETDLGGYNSLGREDASRLTSHRTYDQTLDSAYDRTRNSAYDQSQNLAYGQTQNSAYDQRQNAAYDQSVTRGNSYISQGSQHSTEGVNSLNRGSGYYQNRDSSGRYGVDTAAVNDQSTQQGSVAWDQGRGGNWTTANTYRTDGGNGQVHEERGQIVTGPRQVRFYRKNYTSSFTSGGAAPAFDLGVDGRRSFESEVSQLQRELENIGRGTHQTSQDSLNGGYTQQTSTQFIQPGSTVDRTNYRYIIRPSTYDSQDLTTSGTNSQGTYHRTTNFENQHVSQTGGSSVRDIEQETRRNQNSGYSTSDYGNSNGYDTQRTQRISSVEQPGRTRPPYSDSLTRQSYYDRLSQSGQAEYRRIYGSEGLSQSQISGINTNDQQQSGYTGTYNTVRPSGHIQHYEQFQTSSSSSSGYPDNYGGTHQVQNGQLLTQGLDLGQVEQAADCAEGSSGHSTYEQSHYHRVYRGTNEPKDFTQQAEDLTQQTEDLTQQTEDLTQQTEDLTQQTEDLTQQTQDFGQQAPWRSGKLEVESQRVHELTQQTEDLTQQTEDLTQQTEDLTQQTEDLTQQTQDLTQQTEDLTQQTQDLTQQTEDLTSGKFEVESQQVHDLTQQTEDLTQQTEDLTQQTEDLTQQTQDFTQQTQDLTQQTEDLTSGKFEVESQQVHDLTQQTEDLTQQTEDLTQQTEDLTQQTQDFTQQTQDLTQQTQHLTQQTEDLAQRDQDFGQQSSWRPGRLETGRYQIEDLTHQVGQTDDYYLQKPARDRDFGQESSWNPGKLEVGSQQVDLTQQTEDLTQQTEDLTQQTEDLTQQTEDLTQQTEDLTQQAEDLTQQTEDLTQQTEGFGQESSSKPGKLEIGNQQVDLTQQTEDLTQQTEDLTQQTEDLTQQTEDLTQQTEDLTQQTEDLTQQTEGFGQESSWKPGNLEIASQQVQDLTQKTEDLTQQTEDLTQQTEDLTQQTEDLTQQTEGFEQGSAWKPGKLELGSQQVEDLTQQTEDLTQQTEDFTQQTQDLTQQADDLTQQTEDLTQQTEGFSQGSPWKPGKLEVASQQVEDLTQQTEDLTQQTEDLTQQTQDFSQQANDLTQQTEDLTQQTEGFGQESPWKPGKLEVASQQVEDLTQQTEDLTQQTEDLTQQTEDLTQQTEGFGEGSPWKPGKLELGSQQVEDLTQQTEDLTQQTEDLTQQTQDLTQQTEDLTQQTEGFGQESSWKPGKLEFGSQQVQDLTQQTEDLTQQTEDLTQQTQDLTQQTEDLTQQTTGSDDYPSSRRPGQLEIGSQKVEDLTQQTEDLGQQTQDLTQQTQDLSQQVQNNDFTGQTTGDSGFGQESSWYSPDQGIISQQSEDLHQANQFGTQETTIYPASGTIITPKPAPKPKRPRPGNFHHTQQLNVELEEPTTNSHTGLPHNQQNIQTWESTDRTTTVPVVPPSPHRGDQGIDPNSSEPEKPDFQIETVTHGVSQQQSGYVSTYPDSSSQQATAAPQFRPVQPTKTKTSRRRYHGAQTQPWQGPRDWQPPRDVVSSQPPAVRYVDERPSGQQVTENIHHQWANTEETQQVESSQKFERIQHVGASIEDRHRGGQSDEVIQFQPRILEAYGASGPYDTDHKFDIFDSAKPNPGAALTPPDGSDAWDIRVVDPRITTTTEPPTTPPTTTTTTTTTTTPIPPPTPAPSFWRRVGNSFTNTYDKAKEKAKELFG